ncbi:MAG: hypothetical protein K6E12_10700 [Saccharofermentans sp.]|nr:hypothetical protein [Saccharofermentans sp.]
MNSIILPMKVHAVKLEYRRLELERIPHGHFRTKNGRKYVYVTYDPHNPKLDSRHPCRLLADSKRGEEYAYAVSEYLRLKHEYMILLNEWNSRYGITPPHVSFPILQFADPHKMNNDFYERQKAICGEYTPKNPTVSDHGILKSKNEQMGADLLKLMGIPFKYEPEVTFINSEEIINPDYLISFYEIDRCAYLEILGMNEKVDYSVRTATKINSFSKDTYRPGREVIYVILYDKANFDEDYFAGQVLDAFNNMIPDSAIIWEADSKAS